MIQVFSKTIHWLKQFLQDPEYKVCQILQRHINTDKIPDRMWLKYEYHYVFGHPLDLNNPKTFNEKLQWLKLYDRNPLYTILVDKSRVKEWVAGKIGTEHVIPTIAYFNNTDEIDLDILPNQFVLKCNHDSGSVVICKDKAAFNLNSAKEKLKAALNTDYYLKHREWPYKNINPRIIADKFLCDGHGTELQDYKFWCFNGIPKVMYMTNKGVNIYENFYDMDFQPLNIEHGFPRIKPEYDKPESFELMKNLAIKLSDGIPFVRVDFFDIYGQVYFGEYTFYDWGGFMPFYHSDWDSKLGSWISLPCKK